MHMTTQTGHQVGATYQSSYWGETYTVIEEITYDDWRGTSVRVKWADGHETTHSTPRGRDKLIGSPRTNNFFRFCRKQSRSEEA